MPARSTWPTKITRTAISSPTSSRAPTRGKTWVNIAGNLPERGGVYAIAEDHVNPNLLFAGTEFGLYFTNIGGEKWIKLNIGLPTTMVRDLAIQKQMDDLVIGTFGRSIYVLDDYSPLRVATPEIDAEGERPLPRPQGARVHAVQPRRRSGNGAFHRAQPAGGRARSPTT